MFGKAINILESKGLLPNREKFRKEYSAAEFTEGRTGTVLFAAIIVFMASLAIEFTVVKSQSAEIKEFERLLEELKGDIEEIKGKDSDRKILTDTLAALEDFKNALPGSEEITPIINDIHNVAKENRLRILEAKYSTEVKNESIINRHTMSFPIEGSYKAIKKFIYDIENLEHHLVIDRIALNSASKKGVIGIDVGISVYLKAEE